MPLSGPQKQAAQSKADIIGYGGAAGGGKTDLMVGLALTDHQRAIIYRREAAQLLAVRDRCEDITGAGNWNGQDQRFQWQGRVLELGGARDLGAERRYQGRPHDLKCFDEATEFAESQVRFLMGWLRSADPDQRLRILMGFNPPTTEDGQWVVRFFAPWLDPDHPKPAKAGELRWFTTIDGKDVELEGPDPVEIDGETVTPMSRTFIPAHVEDNPYYMEAGYKRVLQALPEPLRSQMLRGDFRAGMSDDPWQVLPTEWVMAAQKRWTPEPEGPMDALGCDPARGGGDRFALCARYGVWYSEVATHPGEAVQDGASGAALCVQMRRDHAPVHVDVIGIGASVVDHLSGTQVVPVNVASGTKETDKSGEVRMYNLRSLLFWRLREALDPVNGDRIALPPDDELRRELCTPRFSLHNRGIKVETKEDVIKRVGRSPDKADAVLLASINTMKAADMSWLSDEPGARSSWQA